MAGPDNDPDIVTLTDETTRLMKIIMAQFEEAPKYSDAIILGSRVGALINCAVYIASSMASSPADRDIKLCGVIEAANHCVAAQLEQPWDIAANDTD